MAISVRLEFEFNPASDDQATVGDLRRWLDIITKNGVEDSEELIPLLEGHYDKMTETNEVSGFYVYWSPWSEA